MLIKNARIKFGNPLKVDDNDKYTVSFILDGKKEEKKLKKELDSYWEDNGSGKADNMPYSVYKPSEDYADDPDAGKILFKAAQNSTDSKGNEYSVKIFDAEAKLLKNPPSIGWGSIVNLSVDLYTWTFKNRNGLSMGLRGVQIIDLKSYEGGTGSEFEETDGYVAEEPFNEDKSEKKKKKKKKGKK